MFSSVRHAKRPSILSASAVVGLALLLGCDAAGTSTPGPEAGTGGPQPDAATPPDAAAVRPEASVDAAVASADGAADARPDATSTTDAPADAGAVDRTPTATDILVDGASADRAPGDAAQAIDVQATDARPALDAPVVAAETVGFYSGDWGDMVLRIVGNEIRGTYSHDQGTIVGTFRDGVLYAWWSEVPSRNPTADAGECEFRFFRKATGRVSIDGRWRYGAQDAWREDWDIDQVDGQPPAALLDRFMDEMAFRRHP